MRLGQLYENVKIDNANGLGQVPWNQNIDYQGLRVQMLPSIFLKLAAPLGREPTEFIINHIKDGGAIGAPFLTIDIPKEWESGNLSSPAVIRGHEGRNRMLAVKQVFGDVLTEVHLFPSQMKRRHITDEMIKKLRRGLIAEDRTTFIIGPIFTNY